MEEIFLIDFNTTNPWNDNSLYQKKKTLVSKTENKTYVNK